MATEIHPKDLPTIDEGELTEREQDPRIIDLVLRQRKALGMFLARQSTDYLRLLIEIGKEKS
jgi:hypothetical protein